MNRRWLTRKGRIALVLVAVAVVGVSAVAYAYWGASGSGTGSGTTGTPTAVILSPGNPAALLYPSGRADVLLTAANPNRFPVSIGSLGLDAGQGIGGFAVDSGHSGCALSTLSFTAQSNSGAGWTVPANSGGADGQLSIDLPNALAMGVAAVNTCQGASFTVYLAAVL